jgi:hypothetical protein
MGTSLDVLQKEVFERMQGIKEREISYKAAA